MTERDGIGGTDGVQDFPHVAKYFHIDGRIWHCTGHHSLLGYRLMAVDARGIRTSDPIMFRADLDNEQEVALDTNFVPAENGIPIERLVKCGKCWRRVNLSPLGSDVCYDKYCWLLFKVQKTDADGIQLRSIAHPIDESALVQVEVNLPPGMSKIELIARGICQRIGHDPDMVVAHYPVGRLNAAGIEVYRVPPESETFKMWTLFQPLATLALRESKECT